MRRITLSMILLALMITIIGCSPKGDPKETLEAYYANLINEDYKAAYAMLLESDKQSTTRDEFVQYMELNEQLTQLKKVEVKQAEKNGDTVVFDVVENGHDAIENKDKDTTVKRSVTVENGEWKVAAEGPYKKMIADRMAWIGQMYLNGTGGKTLNLNTAVTWFEDALEQDPSYYRANYGLAAALTKLQLYEEAITYAQKYVDASKDNKEKSSGLNILGICYDVTGEREKAKEAFQKAVELNPENKSAQNNLNQFK